ncbi:hypothetical protein SAMN05444166_5730 [Singulisphaera sp. GP187]|nr:hypothetical protein SAMN05444166_5730 [Singulisphaera sp. GP187]
MAPAPVIGSLAIRGEAPDQPRVGEWGVTPWIETVTTTHTFSLPVLPLATEREQAPIIRTKAVRLTQ